MLKAVVNTLREGPCAAMRVLVVEDFEPTARAIVTGLRREGMAVDVAYDGDEALGHLALTRYDVGALDRDPPGVHGDEICRRLAPRRSRRPCAGCGPSSASRPSSALSARAGTRSENPDA